VIDRFNFFDIYGYLLPGGFLLALLWLPIGLVLGKWPPADWGSAALAMALAYIGGHLLRNVAEAAFSSKIKDPQGHPRYPSDLLLCDAALGNLKYRLEAQIRREFGPEIRPDVAQWTDELEKLRQVAFFKCRAFLIAKKAAAYAEQQQGMYELLRGIAAALTMASAFYLGLGVGFSARCWQWCGHPFVSVVGVAFLIIVALIGVAAFVIAFYSLRDEWARRWAFNLFAALLFCGGAAVGAADHTGRLAGFGPGANNHITIAMFVFWAISAILAVHCIGACRRFAKNFARTVYQDFSMLAPPPNVEDTRRRAQQIYVQQGMPQGMDWAHWFEAEQQLQG
jgi:hypothetical protein